MSKRILVSGSTGKTGKMLAERLQNLQMSVQFNTLFIYQPAGWQKRIPD